MLGIERRQKIIEYLQKDQKVYVGMLSQQFDVTEETIRRDLEKLESEGILTRTYGGAVLNQHINEDLPFPTRTSLNQEGKKNIALMAAALVSTGDTLMIDASSTCLELVQALKDKKKLTIITNSVIIPHDFINSNFNIISTGGVLRAHSSALVGPVAQSALKNYYVDMTIISCKGLSLSKGVTESNEPESEIKKSMVQQAEKILLLADHTKFEKTSFIKLFDLKDIDCLVTDKQPNHEWIDFLQEQRIQLAY